MNKLLYTTGLSVMVLLSVACKKEAALTASEENVGYTLPQGNKDYDDSILAVYNKYSVYMLYQFTEKDTYWTPTGWKKATQSSTGTWSNGYEAAMADTQYIRNQLALIQKGWFSYYTDKFLNKFLPSKIMLCSKVDSVYTKYVFTPVYAATKGSKSVGAWYNYDNICINYGNAAVTTMTQQDSITFTAKSNLIFIQSIAGRNLSAPASNFTSIANYAATLSSQANAYAQGIITVYYNTRSTQLDWNAYMEAMVSYSETTLNTSTANTNTTYVGILNPTKDTNGKIRQRYNIIRNYFITNYGVDLQAIGNAANR